MSRVVGAARTAVTAENRSIEIAPRIHRYFQRISARSAEYASLVTEGVTK